MWSSTNVHSGTARARSVSSTICGWYSQASNVIDFAARACTPRRNDGSAISCGVGAV